MQKASGLIPFLQQQVKLVGQASTGPSCAESPGTRRLLWDWEEISGGLCLGQEGVQRVCVEAIKGTAYPNRHPSTAAGLGI